MAIVESICTSFKSELLNKEHDMDTDTFKIALFDSSASLSAATTAYSTSNEITGTGYTAGGETLTGASISTSGTEALVTFDDPSWTSSSFTTRAALVYNSSNSNKAVCVLDFGSDQVVAAGTFSVKINTDFIKL